MKSRIGWRSATVVSFLSAALAVAAGCVGSDEPSPSSATPSDAGDGDRDTGSAADATTPDDASDAGEPLDDAASDAGSDAGPPRYCATRAAGVGVTNFFCADFDGDDPGEGFTSVNVPDGGAIQRDTSIFYSPPASVRLKTASLAWQNVAGDAVQSVELQFRMNLGTIGGVYVPSGQSRKLAGLRAPTSATNIEFQYFDKVFIDSEHPEFTGFGLFASWCPGACAANSTTIATAMPVDVWTKVRIAWAGSSIKVFYNDVEVGSMNASAPSGTSIEASLGIDYASNAFVPPHAFDNFEVSVTRVQP